MKTILRTLLITALLFGAYSASTAFAQNANINPLNPFYVSGTTITPRNTANTLTIPSLGGSGVRCVQTDNAGQLSKAGSGCGSGGGGSSSVGPLNVLQGADGGGGFIATGTNSLAADRFIATSSRASIFPYASTTAINAINAYLTKLGNLTTNGFVKTGSSDGTLSVDTNTYLQTVTADSPLSGSGTAGSHLTISTAGTWSGNAGTATALAANGTNCSAGNYPLGVDASGNSENCTAANTGTVTAVSVASANGLAGSSSGGATPALTLSTTITGLLKGNGTAISAAGSGTDYSLIVANTCSAGSHFSGVTAAGVFTCSADTGSGDGVYPFTLAGNGTSTLTQFNGGLTAYASSTIGSPSQSVSLTVNSTASSTGLKFTQVTNALTGATTTGQALTVDSSGNVVLSDVRAPANGGGQVIYDKTYWSNLNDFTITGTTPTIVNGSIEINPGSPGSFDSDALELNLPTTVNEDVDFEMTVKAVTLGATAYGIGLGRQSINTWYDASLSAHLDTSANPNVMKFWPQASGGVTTAIGTKNVASGSAVAGDIIRYIYSQRGNTVTEIVNNLTQQTYNTYTITNNLSVSKDFKIPNSSKFRIFGFGGTFDIQNIKLISRQPVGPRVVTIGDSKTFGYSANILSQRWASLINQVGPVDVFGGDGDRTVETVLDIPYIASLRPQYAILNIGRNDLASGVSSGTWQANYSSIVSQLKAAGVTVIHLMPIPETTQDQSALTTYINATFPNDVRIDVSDNWSNTPDLSSDGIHPSPTGEQLIAAHILASSTIPLLGNQIYVDPAPLPFSVLNSIVNLNLWQGTSTYMYTTIPGNIGIGSTSPASKLSVQGTGMFSGDVVLANLTATGTLTVAGTATSTFAGGISASRFCLSGTPTTCLNVGGGGGSGTVTSVATNQGLTGGTITTSGTVGLDLTALPVNNLLLTYNGSRLTATGTKDNLTVPGITATSTASSTFAGGVDAQRFCITGTTTCLSPSSSGSGTRGFIIDYIAGTSTVANEQLAGTSMSTTTSITAGQSIQIWANCRGTANPNAPIYLDVQNPGGGTTTLTANNPAAGAQQWSNPLFGIYNATTTGLLYIAIDSSDHSTLNTACGYPQLTYQRGSYQTIGSGGSSGNSFAFPFDPQSWGNSTSTILGLLNGFLSTASSTINAALRLSNLGQGVLYTGTGGLVGPTATGTVSQSGPITVTAGQSVLGSGLTVGCATCALTSTSISAGNGLTGGGDLSTNRTISFDVSKLPVNNLILTYNGSQLTATGTKDNLTVPGLTATSTSATSTFAGGITGPGSFAVLSASGWVGIGTSSPMTGFASAAATNTFAGDMDIGATTASTSITIDRQGHMFTGGPMPVCTSGCATGPSLWGDDSTFRILLGSTITSATITFANTWVNSRSQSVSPACTPTDESGVTTGIEASSTPTTVVLSLPTALTTKMVTVQCKASDNFIF